MPEEPIINQLGKAMREPGGVAHVEALRLITAYEALRNKLEEHFPQAADGEEHENDTIDQAIYGYIFWWQWGN